MSVSLGALITINEQAVTVEGQIGMNATTGRIRQFVSGGASVVASLDIAQAFTGKQTFTPDATNPGINFGSFAGDPSAPVNGDVWYNSTSNAFRARENGVNVDLIQGVGASGWTDDGVVVRLTTATDAVSIGTATEIAKLGVVGNDTAQVTGVFRAVGAQTANIFEAQESGSTAVFSIDPMGEVTIAPALSTGGSPTLLLVTGPAHTTLALSTEASDVIFGLSRVVQFATGALALQRAIRIEVPTYAFVAASTITTAATFAVSGAPIAGANATITNAYAVWVQGGITRLDGVASFNNNMTMAGDFDFLPATDNTGDIGSDTFRFNRIRATNIVSGDLHLKDDAFGTHWVVREAKIAGEDRKALYAIDQKTGEKYRLMLEKIS